ncbi:MAG TPA: ATP-binding cassette domain-containing protein [Steroidobacteraceae bacterium]|nr:ATP-binding cassette domain-containing protein [Steroidobacteraceae bacterium]
MIEALGLHKSFGNVNAVQDVSFEAHDGEITGLLGPNGAGKTTTLRMLYTLMKPQRGEVRVDGFNTATHALEVRKRLGVLPDARGLYRRLTARENIEYYARLQGLSPAAIAPRVDELINMLEMNEFADRYTEGFSQGQRVKTAIARALVHDPRNVIFDEPTNGLDVMATRSLREFLKQLRADGRCVLFSTHIMQEVVALCDRVVIIARGRVIAQGTADTLRWQAGESNLEEAFVKLIGADAGELE